MSEDKPVKKHKKETYLDYFGKYKKRTKSFDVKFIIRKKLTTREKNKMIDKYLEEHKYDHLLERY